VVFLTVVDLLAAVAVADATLAVLLVAAVLLLLPVADAVDAVALLQPAVLLLLLAVHLRLSVVGFLSRFRNRFLTPLTTVFRNRFLTHTQ